MTCDVPLLSRFLAKCALDILPAVLASVVGGLLITHYQSADAVAPQPAAEQASPASDQMLQLVRDEHTLIADFLNAQLAADKQRAADEEEARRAAAAKPAASTARQLTAATVPPRPVLHRNRARPAVAVPHAPLVVAQADSNENVEPVRASDTLIGRTLDVKDRVVAATQRAAAAIGSVASSTGRLVTASW